MESNGCGGISFSSVALLCVCALSLFLSWAACQLVRQSYSCVRTCANGYEPGVGVSLLVSLLASVTGLLGLDLFESLWLLGQLVGYFLGFISAVCVLVSLAAGASGSVQPWSSGVSLFWLLGIWALPGRVTSICAAGLAGYPWRWDPMPLVVLCGGTISLGLALMLVSVLPSLRFLVSSGSWLGVAFIRSEGGQGPYGSRPPCPWC